MRLIEGMDGITKVSGEGVTGVRANLLRCTCGQCGRETSVDLIYSTGRVVTVDRFDCSEWRVGEYGANDAARDRAEELIKELGL